MQYEPNAQDENDSYIGGVYEHLVTGADDKQIADHLLRIVHEQMELEVAKFEYMLQTVERSGRFSPEAASLRFVFCPYRAYINYLRTVV